MALGFSIMKPKPFASLYKTPKPPASIAARPQANYARPAANSSRGPRVGQSRPPLQQSAPRRQGSAVRPASTAPRITSNPTGRISSTQVQPAAVAPPPPPPVPTESEWLTGDTTFQTQMSALEKALADYKAQSQQQSTQYGVDYGAKLNELGIARKQGVSDLQNDFASRGLLQSGLFDNNLTEFNTGMDRRRGDLDRSKSDFEAQLATALSNFGTENNLSNTRARQEALARRAAQFGI
jgi:hypothetical protein